MFTDLHALTQTATLMIVVTSEGEQLRVSVTPTQAGDKMKPHALKPLSLLGTPGELDEYFGAALLAWQAPKKSLIEQAQDAASADDAESDGKPAATSTKAKAAPKTEKGKPGPKKKGPVETALATEETSQADGASNETDQSDKTDAAAEFTLEPAPVAAPGPAAEAEPAEAAPAPTPVVDTKTLDLF